MVNEEKLILSLESAQFLLEGVRFFYQNPKAPNWNNLKRETFLVLAQHLSQLPPEKEEDLIDYLGRLEQYLSQIINQELTPPSLPPNLKELVAAFDEFQKQQDANVKPPPKIKTPTIREWIESLQQTIVPDKLSNLQKKTQNILEQTVAVPKETSEQIAPKITKAVAANAPQLTDEEISQLSSSEKNKIIENVYNAALPEIAATLIENNINLSGKQTADLTNQLTLQTQDHILACCAVSLENRFPQPTEPHKTEGTAVPILTKILHPRETIAALFNRQEQQITQALKKNPTLPYEIAPQNETPLGEQIRNILIVNGINSQTVPLVQSLKQETQGLIFAVRGISSDVLSHALKQGKADNRPSEEINQVAFLLDYQKDFEEKHPRLTQIFKRFHYRQEVLTGVKNDQILPTPPYWLIRSPNQQLDQSRRWQFLRQINIVFEKTGLAVHEKVSPYKDVVHNRFAFYINRGWQTITNWWRKTGWGKKLSSRAQVGIKKFFENILSQFRFLGKTGVKKAAKEGIRRGTKKAFSWLTTKLASTKLGAILGSIAPGIGNVTGAIIGFVVDNSINFLKKGIGLFNRFLTNITGGPTEAEQKTRAALGPFSFLASPLVVILIIAISAPITLTFLTITGRGGSFISSSIEGKPILDLPSLSPNPNNDLAEQVVAILEDCGFDKDTYINKDSISNVVVCLNASSLTEKQKSSLILYISASVNSWTSLQCVGFVQAIEAAQGRILPNCGWNAKDWGNRDCYPGTTYTFLGDDCSQVIPGTIAVKTGSGYGHIGIITGIEEKVGERRFRFVSAWGNPGSANGGNINIISLPCSYFSAFINPK